MNDLMNDPLSEPESTGESILDGLRWLVKRKGFWLGVVGFVVLSWLAAEDVLGGAVLLAVGALLYFLPAVIARQKPNASSVFVINLFLGWTLIGWVVALAMAVSNPSQPPVVRQTAPQVPTPTGRTCPFCAEDIKPEAIVCKHCGRDLPSE